MTTKQTGKDAYAREPDNLHELPPHANRPLWQLPMPLRLTTTSPVSRSPERWRLVSGPERIHFGWWDEAACNRDYYRAINRDGAQAWLFVDKAEGQGRHWYLHGYFA